MCDQFTVSSFQLSENCKIRFSLLMHIDQENRSHLGLSAGFGSPGPVSTVGVLEAGKVSVMVTALSGDCTDLQTGHW